MSKIEWCDLTWNSVWGCLNDCKYCYAKKIAKRFHYPVYNQELQKIVHKKNWNVDDYYKEQARLYTNLKTFKPVWLEHQFQKKLPKKPKRIFVGSMSDIYYWKPEWMERVLEKINEYPQHIFMFLTKFPEVYIKWEWPKNCWLGMTKAINNYIYGRVYAQCNRNYISFEPLEKPVHPSFWHYTDWVIVGAETGNRKNKIIPKREWIEEIVDISRRWKIPIFLKNNLKPIWGDELIQEVPK